MRERGKARVKRETETLPLGLRRGESCGLGGAGPWTEQVLRAQGRSCCQVLMEEVVVPVIQATAPKRFL